MVMILAARIRNQVLLVPLVLASPTIWSTSGSRSASSRVNLLKPDDAVPKGRRRSSSYIFPHRKGLEQKRDDSVYVQD